MAPVGYQEGSEKLWWWKVAMHLDEAQQALANAMAHNLDDQKPVLALQDRLREGQAILLDIFRGKDLLPATPNGSVGSNGTIEPQVVPIPVMSEPAVPAELIQEAELIEEAKAAEAPPVKVIDTTADEAAPSTPPVVDAAVAASDAAPPESEAESTGG